MKLPSECTLYGILDLGYISPQDCYLAAESMRQGGVDIIQLRAKGHPSSEIMALACSLAPLLVDIPFILNDYPQLVTRTGVSGFHIGQEDLSLDKARALAGRDVIGGCSTHNITQAQSASSAGADYISFGPPLPRVH